MLPEYIPYYDMAKPIPLQKNQPSARLHLPGNGLVTLTTMPLTRLPAGDGRSSSDFKKLLPAAAGETY